METYVPHHTLMTPTAVDEHYEDEFEFPLWELIKERAEREDISYSQAAELVVPEYVKNIRYGDTAFEDAVIEAREKEMAAERRYEVPKR